MARLWRTSGPLRKIVDRLPILVSGQNVVRLLSIPKLRNGASVKMSDAVIDNMDEFGLRDWIQGMCFNSTASSTVTKGVSLLSFTDRNASVKKAAHIIVCI